MEFTDNKKNIGYHQAISLKVRIGCDEWSHNLLVQPSSLWAAASSMQTLQMSHSADLAV